MIRFSGIQVDFGIRAVKSIPDVTVFSVEVGTGVEVTLCIKQHKGLSIN